MNANGVLASMCFPSFPRLCGQVFAEAAGQGPRARPGAGLQRLARAVVVREAPRPVHPARADAVLGRRPDASRSSSASRTSASTRSRSPRTRRSSGCPSLHSDALGSVLGRMPGSRDRDLPAHRVVVDDHGHRARRAVRRHRDAPAHEHRRRRGRPRLVAGASQVPDPEDRPVRGWRRLVAVLPRQDRPRVPQAVGVDGPGLRRPTSQRRLQRAQVVTCFLDDRITPEVADRSGTGAHDLGMRLPALRQRLARIPREGARGHGRPRRRHHQPAHPRERDADLPVRPLSRIAPRSSPRSAALRAEAAAAGIDTAPRTMRTREQTLGNNAAAQQDLFTPERS